ncbi:MAG: helix-turn-helix domain-containing protein [Anaerolineae bacterium]
MDTELLFGDWLKRRRRGLGMTQVELGHRTGYAGETIRKVEANEVRPSVQMAEKLAEALFVPTEERTWFIAFARGEGEQDTLPLPTQTAPVPQGAPRPRATLPTLLTSFIGRDRELAEIKRLLSAARLVTLTGPGGSGKTRLALQVAADLRDQFGDGVFFVDLAPITDPALVVSRVAELLGVREQPGQPLLDTLKEILREKQTLLLLDNFEQVVEGGLLVADILAGAAKVSVLVTSREALRLRGEHEYPVMPLPAPGPGAGRLPADLGGYSPSRFMITASSLSQYPAAVLFIERARAVKLDFELTDANAPAVAEICHRLDGLPLAIELAAARIRVLPPEAMLARLDRRMRFLTGGPRDLHTRQQTLQNTIAWSYDLLSLAEQRFFRRLSVFVGGFTVEAAEAVCDADGTLGLDVLDSVESLAAKSLLQAVNDGPRTTDGGIVPLSSSAPRFIMLETIREYAREKLLASASASALHAAHASYFLARAEEAKPPLPLWLEWDWVRRMGVEADNFRAALAWALEHGETEIFARLAAALWEYWSFARHFAEGEAWVQRALDLCAPAELARVRAELLQASSRFAFARGDYSAQRMHAEAALRAGDELGDEKVVATAYMALALYALHHDDMEAGLAWAEKALALFCKLGDKLGATWSRVWAGNYACRLRQYEKAEAYWNDALTDARPAGWTGMILQVTEGQASLARLQGDYARAEAKYREVLASYASGEYRSFANMTLNNLGHVVLRQGRHVEAAALFRECVQCQPVGPAGRDLPPPLTGLAGVMAREGHALAAARVIGGVDRVLADSGDRLELEDRLDYEAILADIRGRLSDAEFNAAWAEGQAMTPEQLVAYALEDSAIIASTRR